MIAQTSLEAYHVHRATGKLSFQERVVYETIADAGEWGLTDRAIHNLTGIEINAVTGRRNELAKKGLIQMVGKRKNPESKMRVQVWVTA